MKRSRELALRVTIKDCKLDTFSSGGPGGSRQNHVQTGVRITHLPSGAKGESREDRSQLQNKRNAFRRMAQTPQFQSWVRMQMGSQLLIDSQVEETMLPRHLRVEGKVDGRWTQMED